MTRDRTVWQRHHITYEPEWVVHVTKGEHIALTWLQRLKSVSPGFLTALQAELAKKTHRQPPEKP